MQEGHELPRGSRSARNEGRGQFLTSFVGYYIAPMILFRSSSRISISPIRPHFWHTVFLVSGYQNICCPGLIWNPQGHLLSYFAVNQNGSLFAYLHLRLLIVPVPYRGGRRPTARVIIRAAIKTHGRIPSMPVGDSLVLLGPLSVG